ncbi:PepSY-associated TM helix domain-containing protein [Longibacter sp.]|uniref:PepSY-associated TM helix domain-containing protein n=1 Tax=Longibacter sp. TaxID=2045415 RepID=UPI003EBF9520
MISNWRKTLFRLHGWIGINLGLLLFVICLSGTVAVFSNEIDWLLNDDLRAEATNGPIAWSEIEASIDQTFPDGVNLGMYAPIERGFAARAYVTLPDGETRKAYFHPSTGELQGHTSFFNTQRFFRSFHRRFFDGDRGIVLVTLMAFPLLFSALTGLLYYKGWLKQLFTIRRDKGRRLFGSDLHKVAGIWGLLFTILIAATGIFYFTEVVFTGTGNDQALHAEPLPNVADETLPAYGDRATMLPAGVLADRARAAVPGLDVRGVRLPLAPTDAASVTGQRGNPITRDRANEVHVNPYTGDVLGIQRSSDLGVVPFITDAADPLHFGYFGSFWTKALWFSFGLMLSFSILTGAYIWVVRSEPVHRHVNVDEDKGFSLRPFPWLRGAVVSVALTLVYSGVVVFSTIDGIQYYAPQNTGHVAVTSIASGDLQGDLLCRKPCDLQNGSTMALRFEGNEMPNPKAVTLTTAAGDAVSLSAYRQYHRGEVTTTPGTAMTISLATWDAPPVQKQFKAPLPVPNNQMTTAGSWPEAAPGVWWVIAGFVLLTVSSIGTWLWGVARAFQSTQAKLKRKRQRSTAPRPNVKLPPTV